MKILVTGYMGFIGGYLFKKLSQEHEVIGLDKKNLGEDINYIINFPRVDLVYHLAAQTSVLDSINNPYIDAKENILSTIRLILAYSNTRIVYTASGGASEQEEILSPYGLSKKIGADYLCRFHKDVVVCNLSNVFGRRGKGVIERFIEDQKLVVYGDGDQTRDFVHVDDVVEGLIKARSWKSGIYQLGSGKEVKILDLAIATGKVYIFKPCREGELTKSVLSNTSPDWHPKVDVFEYLVENLRR